MAVSAAPARAYEDQLTLDAELAYAHAVSDLVPPHGISVGLGASYGLGDTFAVRGQVAYAQHPGEPASASVILGTGEMLYLVDVFEFVPYLGAGFDVIAIGGSAHSWGVDVAVHPVFGLDWLVSRELALGLQLRPMFLLSAFDRDPFYFKAGVSLSYLFEPL